MGFVLCSSCLWSFICRCFICHLLFFELYVVYKQHNNNFLKVLLLCCFVFYRLSRCICCRYLCCVTLRLCICRLYVRCFVCKHILTQPTKPNPPPNNTIKVLGVSSCVVGLGVVAMGGLQTKTHNDTNKDT